MKKNWPTLVLMVCSIALLLVLQGIWLQSVYNNIKRDLRKETSILFSSAMMALQDSIIEKNIKPLPGDTTSEFFNNTPLRNTPGLHYGSKPSGEVRISFDSDEQPKMRQDSLPRSFRTAVAKAGNRKQRGFVLRLSTDTLKPEFIQRNFSKVLKKADMPLNFSVVQVDKKQPKKESGTNFTTDPFPFAPHNFYSAQFSDVRFFILKKLTPQLLFSAFVTLLTSLSFLLMYRSIRSAQRLVEIKNDFIGNITHELKTPISTVSVAIEALKNFKGINSLEITKEYLGIAQHQMNLLSILTDKILKTAIFEEQGVVIESIKVDMKQLIAQVLTSLKLVFEKQHVNVNYEETGNDFVINGNVDHLTNVMHNLIDNAIKYSMGQPEIKILLQDLNDRISISIHDKGQGIASEYQKKIFEKFFRVPTGDVSNIKGYGLGLSYVKTAVNKHQGRITVKSRLNEGSTFVIILPKNML